MFRRFAAIAIACLGAASPMAAQRLQPLTPALAPFVVDGRAPAMSPPVPVRQVPTAAPRPAGTALVIGEFLAGLAGAWVVGFLGYKAGEALFDDTRVEGDVSYSPAGNVGWAIGSFAGSVGASWFVGSGANTSRSLGGAMAGAALPSAALLLGVHDPYLPVYGVVLVAPLQSAAATVGLNSGR